LSPTLVIKALRCAISELRKDWPQELVEWLIELVQLSLDSAFAKYGDNWFRSLIGIPTGGSLSVTLANIAVFYALRAALAENPAPELLAFRRFIDDIAGLWAGTEESFINWSDRINAKLQTDFGLSIKDNPSEAWDFNNPDSFTVFLDIKFRFDEQAGLVTDINIKKTDARAYLHYSSYHPRQTFPSIVYSQALRYRRIINNDITLKERLEDLQLCFINSGYPKNMIKGIMEDVAYRKRTLDYRKKDAGAPFPVVWVQTFGPATPEISELIKKANVTLKLSKCWKDIERPLGIVSRRDKNLGDLVLNRKKFSLASATPKDGTMRCTPVSALRTQGQPCKSCDLMSETSTIKSTVTKRSHKVAGGDCATTGVIYAAECTHCKLQYVGQTVTTLRKRINGHRSWMKKKKKDDERPDAFKKKDDGALAEHLKQSHGLSTSDEFDRSYKFHVLLTVTDPKTLNKCEQLWVDRLSTMDPLGLNLDKPCGVSAPMVEMAFRQSQSQKLIR